MPVGSFPNQMITGFSLLSKHLLYRQQAALAGENQVIVPGGSILFGVGNLNADPQNWINKCMASYYQIPEIFGR